jgi:hypothetical protein
MYFRCASIFETINVEIVVIPSEGCIPEIESPTFISGGTLMRIKL